MKQSEKAVYYAENQAKNHSIYLWGGQGEKVKKLTAVKIAKMENSADNAGRVMKEIYIRNKEDLISKHTKAFDCSGLVIEALKYAGVLPKDYDDTAAGLAKYFQDRTGTMYAKNGDLVYKWNSNRQIVHVGIITGNGRTVTEAKGRDYGVVTSEYNYHEWNECSDMKDYYIK